jgi:hypothetical protein
MWGQECGAAEAHQGWGSVDEGVNRTPAVSTERAHPSTERDANGLPLTPHTFHTSPRCGTTTPGATRSGSSKKSASASAGRSTRRTASSARAARDGRRRSPRLARAAQVGVCSYFLRFVTTGDCAGRGRCLAGCSFMGLVFLLGV